MLIPSADTFLVRCSLDQLVDLVLVQLDLDWLTSQVLTRLDTIKLSRQLLTLTPRIQLVLHELIHGYLPDIYRSIYLNGKIMELLALQLDQRQQRMAEPATVDVPDTMQVKMQQVRDLLLTNLATPPSIRDLAKQVGTNEFSLKQCFKSIFNTTVFGYLQQARMEKARLMLTENGTKIAEVAHSLGYKHATHFTAAFKKHFGFLPNKIRMVLLLLLDCEFDFLCFL